MERPSSTFCTTHNLDKDLVYRIQRDDQDQMAAFVQDKFYYLAQIRDQIGNQNLDDYEARERFTLEWVTPEAAIAANRGKGHGPADQNMLEREALVLELLIREGCFSK